MCVNCGVQGAALAVKGQYPCVCTLWVYRGLHWPLRASIHGCAHCGCTQGAALAIKGQCLCVHKWLYYNQESASL